ncbi:hypothetical protein A3K42_02010 [candidate division WWE3 bacterium RBG_13_37_7]|uniref:Phage holin family protein n=1 Tax=candidate division WWE3 bacterium RBG_13_37_7 TaxID=1802609 RepID=A0A1F4U1Q6_UNCKA|nr:MAG: hypothetical protein A3K42_02010 [candidate division WWE3 bacterium RBG_13_37_7]
MRSALRTLLFTFLAVQAAQGIVNGIVFKTGYPESFYLFILGLAILYFFLKPILKILSLPNGGIGFLFMNFILTLIMIHVLINFVPLINVVPSNLSHLIIFGFVLPSKSLTALWTSVFSAFLIALVFTFLDWLCPTKKT